MLFMLLFSKLYGELTIEEKVGQLIVAHFNGDIANENAYRLIHEAHVGGIIYYKWANALKSPQQVQELSNGLQKLAFSKVNAIPLFIAVDQEGGVVNRLTEGFTVFPGNYALGKTRDPLLAYESACAMSQEMRAVGINVNFAPVVDVAQSNSILGLRCFSNTPEDIVAFGKATLEGFKKSGIISSLKHFPGLGNALIDPHQGLPVLNKSFEDLEKWELVPFDQLKDQAEMIMTAHLLIPELDTLHCATLSKTILDTLRYRIGFKGIIISDSLIMQGVLDNGGGVEETAAQAFLAGCDLLLLGGRQLFQHQNGLELTVDDVLRIHRYLVDLVKTGVISEERINESLERILYLKKSYGLFEQSFPNENDIVTSVQTDKNRALAHEITQKSVCFYTTDLFQ